MIELTLQRKYSDKDGQFGVIQCVQKPHVLMWSLELPWLDNRPQVSSIPVGTYPLKIQWSPNKKKNVIWVLDVPHRDAIQMHIANYTSELRGCIAPGFAIDIGKRAVLQSAQAYAVLHTLVEQAGGVGVIRISYAPTL